MRPDPGNYATLFKQKEAILLIGPPQTGKKWTFLGMGIWNPDSAVLAKLLYDALKSPDVGPREWTGNPPINFSTIIANIGKLTIYQKVALRNLTVPLGGLAQPAGQALEQLQDSLDPLK